MMKQQEEKTLFSTEAASACGVSRGTINYWIKRKNLYAKRLGRGYSIPIVDLIQFLQTNGYSVPEKLTDGTFRPSKFKTIQPCWECVKSDQHRKRCRDCLVFKNQLKTCFTSRNASCNSCDILCSECEYYESFYLPRISFVNQIDLPSAVYKDLYFWGGNSKFADMCGFDQSDLIGLGLERVIHPQSMETVISIAKRRAMKDPKVPRMYPAFFKNRRYEKLSVRLGVCPLSEPSGTYFVFVDQIDHECS